jgi:hypothetical protein
VTQSTEKSSGEVQDSANTSSATLSSRAFKFLGLAAGLCGIGLMVSMNREQLIQILPDDLRMTSVTIGRSAVAPTPLTEEEIIVARPEANDMARTALPSLPQTSKRPPQHRLIAALEPSPPTASPLMEIAVEPAHTETQGPDTIYPVSDRTPSEIEVVDHSDSVPEVTHFAVVDHRLSVSQRSSSNPEPGAVDARKLVDVERLDNISFPTFMLDSAQTEFDILTGPIGLSDLDVCAINC